MHLSDVLHRVAYLGEHVVLYRCGERLGVVVPLDEYEQHFGTIKPSPMDVGLGELE